MRVKYDNEKRKKLWIGRRKVTKAIFRDKLKIAKGWRNKELEQWEEKVGEERSKSNFC